MILSREESSHSPKDFISPEDCAHIICFGNQEIFTLCTSEERVHTFCDDLMGSCESSLAQAVLERHVKLKDIAFRGVVVDFLRKAMLEYVKTHFEVEPAVFVSHLTFDIPQLSEYLDSEIAINNFCAALQEFISSGDTDLTIQEDDSLLTRLGKYFIKANPLFLVYPKKKVVLHILEKSLISKFHSSVRSGIVYHILQTHRDILNVLGSQGIKQVIDSVQHHTSLPDYGEAVRLADIIRSELTQIEDAERFRLLNTLRIILPKILEE